VKKGIGDLYSCESNRKVKRVFTINNVYQRDQLSPRDILAAQDSMIFQCRFGDLMASNGKSLTTKVVGLDDTFDLDMWKAQFRQGS
jgi:hypothetical protein